MRKVFLKTSIFCLLAAGVPMVFTGCKDNEDWKPALDEQNVSFDKQLQTLTQSIKDNEAIAKAAQEAANTASANAATATEAANKAMTEAEAANKTAGEAKAAGDQAAADAAAAQAASKAAEAIANEAKAAADAASTIAEEAKKAAADAQAAAATQIVEEINKAKAENKEYTDEEISKLSGQISGISEGLNELKNSKFGDRIDENAEAIAQNKQAIEIQQQALAAFQSAITGQLSTITTDIATAQSAIEALGQRIDALDFVKPSDLNTLKTQLTTVQSTANSALSKVSALETTVSGIQSQLGTLLAKVNTLESNGASKSDIQNLKNDLSDLSSTLSQKIDNSVNTLQSALSFRLTSVTLIPSAYVGGIPAIDFLKAKYQPWTLKSATNKDEYEIAENATYLESGDPTTAVSFRLNPRGIKASDITEPEFVFSTATTRADVSPLVTVDSWEVAENGRLNIVVKRGNGDIETGKPNLINIASLAVPMAQIHWLKGETADDAVVYSEYMRLAESVIKPFVVDPELINAPEGTPGRTYYSYSGIYGDFREIIAKYVQVPYNEPFDMNEVVGVGAAPLVSAETNDYLLTDDQLAALGLTRNYYVAETAYNIAGVNQQDYAEVTVAGELTSTDPNNLSPSRDAIGKTPVIRVEIKDKNNRVVDVRFVVVEFINNEKPLELTYEATVPVSCDIADTAITWATVQKDILDVLGMTEVQFLNFYPVGSAEFTVPATADYTVPAWKTQASSSTNKNAIIFDWKASDFGTIEFGQSKDCVYTLTLKDPTKANPDIVITYNVTAVLAPVNEVADLAGKQATFWADGFAYFNILPVQYDTPGAATTCTYNFPIWDVFTNLNFGSNFNGTSLVQFKEGFNCAGWDVQLATKGNFTAAKQNGDNYALKYGTGSITTAAYLDWIANQGITASHQQFVNTDDFKANFVITDPDATADASHPGIALVAASTDANGNVVTFPLNFKARFEGVEGTLATYQFHIVKPLDIKTQPQDKVFLEDGKVGGSKVTLDKVFNVKDFRGYAVNIISPATSAQAGLTSDTPSDANTPLAKQLGFYYGVEKPQLDLENTKIGCTIDANGNMIVTDDESKAVPYKRVLPNASLTFENNDVNSNTLVFENVGGVQVTRTVNLYIPVTISYKWEKNIKTYVTVPLQPTAVITKKIRK